MSICSAIHNAEFPAEPINPHHDMLVATGECYIMLYYAPAECDDGLCRSTGSTHSS